MPHVLVIAGSNGAGKTTVAPVLLNEALQINHFVNADIIAVLSRLKRSPFKPVVLC